MKRLLLLCLFVGGLLFPAGARAAIQDTSTTINIQPGRTDCRNFLAQPDEAGKSINFTVDDSDIQPEKKYIVEVDPKSSGCNPILSAASTPPSGPIGYLGAIFSQKVADPCHALIFNNPGTKNQVYLYEVDSSGNKIGSPLCTSEYTAQVAAQINPDPNVTSPTAQTPPTPATKASEPLKCDPPGQPAGSGINTALGCIPVGGTNAFAGWFLRWAIGIAGGVAFILMLIAGFQIMTASGNPEKIQGGKELLNAAISGLILIVFSAFLLKLIGVDILALPGFGS